MCVQPFSGLVVERGTNLVNQQEVDKSGKVQLLSYSSICIRATCCMSMNMHTHNVYTYIIHVKQLILAYM